MCVHEFDERPGTSGAKPDRLLAALEHDRAQLARFLEPVELGAGQMVNGSGIVGANVYFRCGSIISLLYETAEAETCEIAIVGNEGMAGLALVLGGGSRFVRSVVQGAGPAYRMDGEIFAGNSGPVARCSSCCCATCRR